MSDQQGGQGQGGAADGGQQGAQGGQQGAGTVFNGGGSAGGQQGAQGGQQAAGSSGGSFRDTVLAEDGSFVGKWTDRLPDDLKQHEATLGRFPNFVEMARSYVHARSKLGEKVAPPPAENATPEQVKAWRALVGAPETAEGYGIKKPDKLPDGVEWNDDLAKGFAAMAHKHHLPPAAVQEIMGWWTEQSGNLAKAGREAAEAGLQTALKKQEDELRQAWGQNMDEKFGIAMRAARTFGLQGNPADWTPKDIVMALEMAGRSISEDKLLKADGPGSGMSSRQAANAIMDHKNQDRMARAYRGEFGAEEQAQAAAHVAKLLQAADKEGR